MLQEYWELCMKVQNQQHKPHQHGSCPLFSCLQLILQLTRNFSDLSQKVAIRPSAQLMQG